MIQENDVVQAKGDLSELVLSGTKGAVVMIYTNPTLAYEVEFVDKFGETLDLLTVCPDDIEQC